MPIPFAFARAIRSAIGSAPGDNTKIIGVAFKESVKAPSKSNGGLSINLGPNSYPTYFFIPKDNFSSRITFNNINFWKGVSLYSN